MDKTTTRILLIEDNPGDARLVKESLAEAGASLFELVTVKDLARGFAHLAGHPVDAILLDLTLPDSAGFDTFTKVYEKAPQVPIILLTGMQDEEQASRAVQEGAQDYLVKGQVDGSLLVRSIRYAIERKRAEAALTNAAAEWRATFDAVSDGVCLLDESQKILRCNRAMADMFGKSFDEMVGRPCWEIVYGTTEPIPGCPVLRARKSLRRETMDYKIGEGWFLVTVDPREAQRRLAHTLVDVAV